MNSSNDNKRSDYELRILEKAEIECRDVRSLAAGLIDKDIGPTLCARLDAHTAGCPECEKFMISYRATIELASELPRHELTREIQNRLRAALNERLGIGLRMV